MDLILIAFASAFAVIWLISYIPLKATALGKMWSPRLKFCNLLIPMDVGFTLLLICGSWVGLATAAAGIGMIIYNVFTGIGLSMAVLIMRKLIIPRWTKKFNLLKQEYDSQIHAERISKTARRHSHAM